VVYWSIRIAAIALWVQGFGLGWLALREHSPVKLIVTAILALWGGAVWYRRVLAIRILIPILVMVALLLPFALINPFHALDVKSSVAAEPGFAARTIGSAIGGCALAGALAIYLLRALRSIQDQSGGTVASAGARSFWIGAVTFLGIVWVILLVGSTIGFLQVVRERQTTARTQGQSRQASTRPPTP
jgi:hypothetical protein